jgi:hypothetical protein
MPAYELHRQITEDRFDGAHFSMPGEDCVVATTAAAQDDEVEVTFPNSDDPNRRQVVNWRVSVKVVGGVLQPRYPQRDDKGAVFQTDSGELWLMW